MAIHVKCKVRAMHVDNVTCCGGDSGHGRSGEGCNGVSDVNNNLTGSLLDNWDYSGRNYGVEGNLGNSSSAIRCCTNGDRDNIKGSSVKDNGDNDRNKDGRSGKEGTRVAGAGKKAGPSTRITSGDVVGGEGNNIHRRNDSDVADSDVKQRSETMTAA